LVQTILSLRWWRVELVVNVVLVEEATIMKNISFTATTTNYYD
jgi:hypothetical protein